MIRRPLRVLVADDDPEWLILLARIVRESCPDARITSVSDGEQAERCLGRVDACVLDHRMPGVSGDRLRAEAEAMGVPVVLVSSVRPLSHRGYEVAVPKDLDSVRAAVGKMLRRATGPLRLVGLRRPALV